MEVSERRLAANRANAMRSTGPKSPEGKRISRANAMTHGLCAEVVPMPHENDEEIALEREAWVRELAPQGVVAARLAEGAFMAQLRLTRCRRFEQQNLLELQATAAADWTDARLRELDQAWHELGTCAAAGLHRLESTPDGCAVLIDLWVDLLRKAEAYAWNEDERARFWELHGAMGNPRRDLMELSKPFLELCDIRNELRQDGVAIDADVVALEKAYSDFFVSKVVRVRKAGEQARTRLIEVCRARIEDLEKRMEVVRPLYEARRALASDLALVDLSPRGQKLSRYMAEAERSLHRNIREALAASKRAAEEDAEPAGAAATTQPAVSDSVAEMQVVPSVGARATSSPPVARNEPILEPAAMVSTLVGGVSDGPDVLAFTDPRVPAGS
jgi:hypothetical protein